MAKKITPQKTPKRSKKEPAALKTPRRLKSPKYKTLRLSKRIKPSQPKLPSVWRLLSISGKTIKNHWRLYAIMTLIYGALTYVMVRGIGGGVDLKEIKSTFEDLISGQWSGLMTGAVLYSYLLGSASSSSTESGAVYQSLLMIIISLAVIWSLRQAMADKPDNKIRVRDTFYRGMYPLVPFVLVLMVVGLQLLPLAAGSWVYSAVVGGGIAVTIFEKVLWGLLFFLLALLSLYMVCSSLFALYIVTLPDMTPMVALRSARQLVLHRRWTVLRKIIFLPIFLLVVSFIIMVPLVLLLTGLAQGLFLLLSMFTVILVHGYMYALYRELL